MSMANIGGMAGGMNKGYSQSWQDQHQQLMNERQQQLTPLELAHMQAQNNHLNAQTAHIGENTDWLSALGLAGIDGIGGTQPQGGGGMPQGGQTSYAPPQGGQGGGLPPGVSFANQQQGAGYPVAWGPQASGGSLANHWGVGQY